MVFLYRKNGGEILGVSVDAAAYAGSDATYFGTLTDPTLTNGANLQLPKRWDGATVRNATAPEIAAFATAKAEDENLRARVEAIAALQGASPMMRKALRCIVSILVDELNVLRTMVVGVGTATAWDPANLTNATGATSPNIAVAGAAFGDFVEVAAPYSVQGLSVTGYVSAANTVVIRLHNGTGGAINLAAGDWKVCVRRDVALAVRTDAQAFTAIVNRINAGTYD